MKLKNKEKEIIKLYTEENSTCKIAKLLNCDDESIREILLKNNIKIRKRSDYRQYKVNDLFFENINNEEKAYCLGLWFSDGYNNEKDNCVCLKMTDLDILEKVKEVLKFNGKIYLQKKYKQNERNVYSLRIFSKKLSQDLSKLGCFQKKTYHINFPINIDKRIIPCFIRGLFDGDGCISFNHNKNKRRYNIVKITGTKNICEGLQNYLKYGKICLAKKNLKTGYESYNWQIQNKNDIVKFLNLIYNNSCIHMDRKFNKSREFLNNEFSP